MTYQNKSSYVDETKSCSARIDFTKIDPKAEKKILIKAYNSTWPICQPCNDALHCEINLYDDEDKSFSGLMEAEGGGGCNHRYQSFYGKYSRIEKPIPGWLLVWITYQPRVNIFDFSTKRWSVGSICGINRQKCDENTSWFRPSHPGWINDGIFSDKPGLRERILLIQTRPMVNVCLHPWLHPCSTCKTAPKERFWIFSSIEEIIDALTERERFHRFSLSRPKPMFMQQSLSTIIF